LWAFETDDWIYSLPTVADGIVFVGSFDNNLYAVEAEVAKSSEGSRLNLGSFGHYGDWESANQSININTVNKNYDSEDLDSESSELVPGFGIGSGIAALGTSDYILKRRLEDDSE